MGRPGVIVRSIGLMLLASTAAACGPGAEQAGGCRFDDDLVAQRAVEHRPARLGPDELDHGPPAFVVMVVNTQPSVERVRLAIDGRSALDVDLPASPDGCAYGGPVFSFGYDLPPGEAAVGLDVQGGTSEATVTVPADGTAWGVVDVQSQRAWSDLAVHDERPEFG